MHKESELVPCEYCRASWQRDPKKETNKTPFKIWRMEHLLNCPTYDATTNLVITTQQFLSQLLIELENCPEEQKQELIEDRIYKVNMILDSVIRSIKLENVANIELTFTHDMNKIREQHVRSN